MAQVALADSLQLPPDSTGKRTGMAKVNIGGTDVYLPASVLVDASGNVNDSSHPVHARLTDGTSNYDGAKTGQLPSALVGGRLDVNVGAAAALTLGAGAATVGTVLNVGDVDHDAVNTGKVVQTGGHASPNTTPPAAVSAAGDRARTWVDLNGASIIRPRKVPTYHAVYRNATRPYYLDVNAFTANTRRQFATIHHAAAATKTVKIRRVSVTVILIVTAATELNIDLVRITSAPTTPAPAITPGLSDNTDAAAEATCMALPGTAGTEGAVIASQYASLGITGAGSTVNPPVQFPRYELVSQDQFDDEAKLPTIRAGVLEGWAVTFDSTAAARVIARVDIQFTEET